MFNCFRSLGNSIIGLKEAAALLFSRVCASISFREGQRQVKPDAGLDEVPTYVGQPAHIPAGYVTRVNCSRTQSDQTVPSDRQTWQARKKGTEFETWSQTQ